MKKKCYNCKNANMFRDDMTLEIWGCGKCGIGKENFEPVNWFHWFTRHLHCVLGGN
jgi:ribosomal protein L37AE/L43A